MAGRWSGDGRPWLSRRLHRQHPDPRLLRRAVAVTVDVLWGFSGILTFGQSAFFGARRLCDRDRVHAVSGLGRARVLAALAVAVALAAAVAGLSAGSRSTQGSTPLYASVISLVLPIVLIQLLYSGGEFTGSSSGLVGFESLPLDLPRLGSGSPASARWRWRSLAWILCFSAMPDSLSSALRDNETRCAYLGIEPDADPDPAAVGLRGRRGAGRLRLCPASAASRRPKTPASPSARSS